MPAPPNNTNAMTNHGVPRSRVDAQRGLRRRKLPPGFRYVRSEVAAYLHTLTREAEAEHGELTREHLETLEAAGAWHQHSLYVLRILRTEHDKLTPETKVQFSAEIAKAVEKRVAQVKQLKLGSQANADPWLTLSHHNAADAVTREDRGTTLHGGNRRG